MGTIKAIEDAYTQTKSYIVYDSFQTIMIALVLFLLFTKLWEEYQKNIGSGKRFDIAAYWGQMRIYVLACFIASSSGLVFSLTESVCADLQDALVTGINGDSSEAVNSLTQLVNKQEERVSSQMILGISFDEIGPLSFIYKALSGLLLGLGIFLFKYTAISCCSFLGGTGNNIEKNPCGYNLSLDAVIPVECAAYVATNCGIRNKYSR